MPFEFLRKRNVYATQDNMITGIKCMDVVTYPGSDLAWSGNTKTRFAHILGSCYFDIIRFTFKDMNLMACPFGNRCVIGEFNIFGRKSRAMRFQENVKFERLWRLHRTEIPTRGRIRNDAGEISFFDCINNGNAGNGRTFEIGAFNASRDQSLARKGTGGIVDQDDIWWMIGLCERFEPCFA